MKKEILGVLTALLSALAATACCLPPLLFLLFGISFGFLSFLEVLTPLRLPLSFLSLGILYFSYRAYASKSLTCNIAKRQRNSILYGTLFVVIIAMLIYPEVAQFLFEE